VDASAPHNIADALKALRKIQAGKGFLVLKKTLVREDRRTI